MYVNILSLVMAVGVVLAPLIPLWIVALPSRERRSVPVPALMQSHCTGVMVGGCVIEGASLGKRVQAHAHTAGDGVGWICFRNWYYFQLDSRRLHELAHLACPVEEDDDHGPVWRATLNDLRREYRRVLQ